MKRSKPKQDVPSKSGQKADAAPAGFVPHRHQRSDDANAFMPDPEDGPARIPDDLAENMAEGFLQAATSGNATAEESQDEIVPEEIGGPFVETSGDDEFASGTDESNPPDAEREPLPRTGPSIVDDLEP